MLQKIFKKIIKLLSKGVLIAIRLIKSYFTNKIEYEKYQEYSKINIYEFATLYYLFHAISAISITIRRMADSGVGYAMMPDYVAYIIVVYKILMLFLVPLLEKKAVPKFVIESCLTFDIIVSYYYYACVFQSNVNYSFIPSDKYVDRQLSMYFFGYSYGSFLSLIQDLMIFDMKFKSVTFLGILVTQSLLQYDFYLTYIPTILTILLFIFTSFVSLGIMFEGIKNYINQFQENQVMQNFIEDQLPMPLIIFQENSEQKLEIAYFNKSFSNYFLTEKQQSPQNKEQLQKIVQNQQNRNSNIEKQQESQDQINNNNIEFQKQQQQKIQLQKDQQPEQQQNQVGDLQFNQIESSQIIAKNTNKEINLCKEQNIDDNCKEKQQQKLDEENQIHIKYFQVKNNLVNNQQTPEQTLNFIFFNEVIISAQIMDKEFPSQNISQETTLKQYLNNYRAHLQQKPKQTLFNCKYQQKQFDIIIKNCSNNENDQQKIIILINDISERQQNIELQQSKKSQNVMLACITHDLKTPLNSIINQLKMASEINKQKEIQPFIDISYACSKMMLFLVFDILDYSKILLDQQIKTHVSEFKLKNLIRDIKNIFYFQITQKNIILEIKIQEKLQKLNLNTDQLKLQQILLNLISNSLKFTKPNGKIELNVFQNDNIQNKDKSPPTINFQVKDTGCGMSPEQLHKIFTLFTTFDKESGYGLGLYLSQQILQCLHTKNSQFKVSSNVDQGSSFEFTIFMNLKQGIKYFNQNNEQQQNISNNNLNNQEQIQNSLDYSYYEMHQFNDSINDIKSDKKPSNQNTLSILDENQKNLIQNSNKINQNNIINSFVNNNKYKFLIVDDEAFNHVNFRSLIERYYPNSSIDNVFDGSDAIKIIQLKGYKYYDIIIMDNKMPMTGPQACKIIRQQYNKDVPIFFSSANNTPEELNYYKSVGGNEFFDKPITDPEEFPIKLSKYLK